MPRLIAAFSLAALAVLIPTSARAEMIGFSYKWSIGPSAVYTGTNPDSGNGMSTGSVAFALKPDGSADYALGAAATRVEGATITTSSSAGGELSRPDSYDTSFSLTLHLTDAASGQSGEAVFTASLSGALTADRSDLTAAFASPPHKKMIASESLGI